MFPAWPFAFLPGSPVFFYFRVPGLTHAFGDDHKSMFSLPVFCSGAPCDFADLCHFCALLTWDPAPAHRDRLAGSAAQVSAFARFARGFWPRCAHRRDWPLVALCRFRCDDLRLWYAHLRHRRQHGWTCPQSARALFSAFSRSVSGDAFISWSLTPSTVSRLRPPVACWLHELVVSITEWQMKPKK